MVKVTAAPSSSGLEVIILTDVLPAEVPVVGSIYGIERKNNTWFCPGFIPFGIWVFEDIESLETICDFTLDSKALALKKHLEDEVEGLGNSTLKGFTPKIKPYEHQIDALSLAMHMPRVGLFLDPGLGKTKIGCDLIQYTRKENPNSFWLVVALKVNQFTWKKEMDFHSEGELSLIPITATGKSRAKKVKEAVDTPGCAGIVVTYDTCRVAKELLRDIVPYTDVILDESHSIRTATSGKTKAVLGLLNCKPVKRRLLLSGTPSLGSPQHLWGQLRAIGNFVVPNPWQFINTYAIRAPYNKHIIMGYKNLDQLNDLVTSVSMRRTAEECLDLPDRVTQIVEIEPTSKTKKLYNTTVGNKGITVGGITLGEPTNPLTVMTRLAQLSMGFIYKSLKNPALCDGCTWVQSCVASGVQPYTGKCKVETKDPGREIGLVGTTEVIDSVVELVESHVRAGKKVIVWAKHQWVLSTLYDKLHKVSENVFTYGSSTKNHSEVEEAFNQVTEGIIIAQISMGIGVTFKAPVMVYAELSWSLDHWLQSLDRNYGIRAKGLGKLLVQVVVLKNSISHSSMRLLKSKVDVSSLMSKSAECVSCVRVFNCLSNSIKPFDSDCILDPQASKTTLSIKPL